MAVQKWNKIITLLLLAGCCLWCLPPAMGAAEQAVQSTDREQLLQKGLNLYEIDQELLRITAEESRLEKKRQETEQEITASASRVEASKAHAAKVLRAYHMGERDSLWLLIFSIDSFSDALSTMEYLQMILSNDRKALQKHSDAWTRLQEQRETLAASADELQKIKSRYLEQRSRLLALQQDIDSELARSQEAEALLREMEALNTSWREQGVPLFRTYFSELARAMKQLPDAVLAGQPAGEAGASPGAAQGSQLILNDPFNYTFQITDSQLNAFLGTKNELFRSIHFEFRPGEISASGEQEGMALSIRGTYELAYKSENKEQAFIRFRTQELKFKEFVLPTTTVEAFEKEFDLGIYPQFLAPSLQVTGVELTAGKLSVKLKWAL